jgi:2-keto-4-pentenoate hydratase/2-oxohepta-3-ene-1,7-dioic acid hydratase in catechol pathway
MDLDVSLTVNGVTRQDSNTSNLIFDIPRIVSTLSAGVTLEVGDLVEARIERIGSLRNRVVSED